MGMKSMQAAPDREAIKRDLAYMMRRWHEIDQPVMFELRAFGEGKQPHHARFSPDWIDEGVDWAAEMNALGLNVYVVRNPVDSATSKAATDADIVAAFFLWADCDDPASAGNVHRFDGPKWSAAVTTGRTPSVRVHVYWELEDPCLNMDAWRQMQTDIAAHFKSDPAVINPSRVMRVGGTVAYPDSKKQAKGYISEIATIRTEYDDEREPVSFDQMRRVFAHSNIRTAPAGGGFHVDTGHTERSAEHYADILRRARTDGEKHGGVRDLAASLAGSGVSRHMAEAIIREACPVYDAGVVKLIETAYAKFYQEPDHQFREMTDAEKDAVPALMFEPWGHRDLAAIPVPQFVYSDFYARGYTSVTLAPPKVGKSMLGLAEALDMATGRGFLTGQPRDPVRVVYYNAEDDQDVINSRVSALLTLYGIDQSEIAETLFPVSGVDRGDFFMISGQDGVINEPLFVGLEKFITHQRADALIFDPLQDLSRSPETNEVFRLLGQRLRSLSSSTAVALGLIHHTRKIAPGTTPSIDDGRGGSALRGTARFNRLLIGMSEDEGIKAGVANHRHFMRIADMESNLAPPSSEINRWFEKVSVLTPNGHQVGAIKRWEWPDAFDGVTAQDAAKVRNIIDTMDTPPRLDVRAKSWFGKVIAEVIGLDLANESDRVRVKAIAKKWLENDVLRAEQQHDNRTGRDVEIVICGGNNPLSEVTQ
jgi:RecA-family ATPase